MKGENTMDTMSNPVNRRSFLGLSAKLAAGAAGAVVLANVAGNSASAEHSGITEVWRGALPLGNGAYQEAYIEAFAIETASGRQVDWSSAKLVKTGKLLSLELPTEFTELHS
jgi:hypothetical protein